jgi:hypothetical protein
MQMLKTIRARTVGVILLSLATTMQSSAFACNVPVYRYALERWNAAPYRLTLLHREPLNTAEMTRVEELTAQDDFMSPRYALSVVDAKNATDPAEQRLLSEVGDVNLPAIVLQYPAEMGIEKPIVVAPWESKSVANLLDSPTRKELAQRLASGQSAVWLVLQSGNAEKDAAAVSLLEEELTHLQSQLVLPEQDEDAWGNPFVGPPLKIEFSVLPVSRSAEEAALIAMLLGSEPDLAERDDTLVFPVFGRGRALFPLVGAGITAGNVGEYAEFLVGACSCQVKEQNPGFDLLLTADWEQLLREKGTVTTPVEGAGAVPTTPAESPRGEPELVSIPRGAGATAIAATETPATEIVVANKIDIAEPAVAPASKESALSSPVRRLTPWVTGLVAVGLLVAIFLWRRAHLAVGAPGQSDRLKA